MLPSRARRSPERVSDLSCGAATGVTRSVGSSLMADDRLHGAACSWTAAPYQNGCHVLRLNEELLDRLLPEQSSATCTRTSFRRTPQMFQLQPIGSAGFDVFSSFSLPFFFPSLTPSPPFAATWMFGVWREAGSPSEARWHTARARGRDQSRRALDRNFSGTRMLQRGGGMGGTGGLS